MLSVAGGTNLLPSAESISCSSEIEYPPTYGCANNINGKIVEEPYVEVAWAARSGDNLGVWINVQFGREVILQGLRFISRCYWQDQISGLHIDYSSGHSQEVTKI